ncbi:MAG: thiamine-phosphate kinase [Aigarchaeota archaeon]|nr:thiamine-phosphate kinase [Candidatus Pelearchaeum maunauluense]
MSIGGGSSTLSDVGEDWVLAYIQRRLGAPHSPLLGRGDDATAFRYSGVLVLSTDMLVEDTDVPPGMSWEQVGRKAVVAVVSDLAAKGAEPLYILTSLGLKPSMLIQEFEELWRGLETGCREYGISIVGGDTNQCDSVVISVAGVGRADNGLIPRSGARPGDILATTGMFGETAAGLHALLNNIRENYGLIESVLNPRARLKEGRELARSGVVSSCIDSSDGLARSLIQLANASRVGFEIDNIPVSEAVERYAADNRLDPLSLALYGGEEYELVFTVKQDGIDMLSRRLAAMGSRLIILGRVIEDAGVIRAYYRGKWHDVIEGGWEHFKR